MTEVFDRYETKLCLEKLVIGLEEPILIKGVGKFLAKVDSGNGGYNVIHGQDVIQQGDVITFKTYDENEQPKMVSKKLKEFINVNIGSGNVEERPVIELDVKFAGELYKKIPFSVANRNSNTHKILICKDFVQKELDALIDVSGKSITKDKVEVEYVNESKLGDNIKDVKDELKRDDISKTQKAGYVARKVGKGLLQSLQQAGKFTDAQLVGDAKSSEGDNNAISGYSQQAMNDAKLIREKVKKEKPSTYGLDKKISDNDIICFKLVDYLGKYFNGDDVVPSEKQMFDEYQQMLRGGVQDDSNKNTQNNQQTQNQNQQKSQNNQQQKQKANESFVSDLYRLLTEANQTTNNNQPVPNNQQQQQNKNADNNTIDANKKAEYERLYQLRNVFFTYFVLVAPNANVEKAKWNEKISKVFSNVLKDVADKAMKSLGTKEVTQKNNGILYLYNQIKEKLNSIDGVKGTFAFCYTKGGIPDQGTRNCVIYNNYLVGTSSDEAEDNDESDTGEQKAVPEDIKQSYDVLKKDWEDNMFLKNVKMDINSKYDNKEKRNELKKLAASKSEATQENEESLTESFLPYLNRYVNRVYGYNYYVTEDANEEQKPAEENEKKEEEKQTGSTGEDALANVDFKAIAAKQEDKAMVAKEAEKAEQTLRSFVDTVQKGYFTLDSEEQKSLGLEVFEPKVEDGESNSNIDEKSKEKLTTEEQQEAEQKHEELERENQEPNQRIKELEEELKKAKAKSQELESEKKKRTYFENLRKSIRNDWNEIISSWLSCCGELGVKCNLSLSNFEETKKRIEQKYTERLKKETQENNWSERQFVIDVYNTRIDPLLQKIKTSILPQAESISKEFGIDVDDLFPPKVTEEQEEQTKQTSQKEEQAWSLNRYFARG